MENRLAILAFAFSDLPIPPVRWPKDSILFELLRRGHLEALHVWAVDEVLKDIETAQGHSGKVTSSWREYVDQSVGTTHTPVAFTNTAYKRLEILESEMTKRELALLTDLLADLMRRTDGPDYYAIGCVIGPYRNKHQVQALATGRVHAMLERVAQLYGR